MRKKNIVTLCLFLVIAVPRLYCAEKVDLPSPIELAQKSVVNIKTDKHYVLRPNRKRNDFLTAFSRDFFEYRTHQARTINFRKEGSGVFIDDAGLIITNAHVVEGSDKIQVVDHLEDTYKAELISVLNKVDLALLKVNYHKKVPVVSFAKASDLTVGQDVYALGAPFGLKNTVTKGVLSNLDRKIVSGQEVLFERMIQTDAAINPGNSGGPLVDSDGNMLGLLTAKYRAGQGLGFALPIDMIENLIPHLKAVQDRTALLKDIWVKYGVFIEEAIDEYKKKWILIYDVDKRSKAYKAGIRKGDRLLRINQFDVRDLEDLLKADKTIKHGERIFLHILRAEKQFFTYLEID